MEFRFDLKRYIKPNDQGLHLITPILSFRSPQICEIIDSMGRESARAQSLPSIITTSSRFFSSSDNKLYLKIQGNKVLGILKTGIRKLFYSNEIGRIIELTPLCLLDFYVHESCQRSGIGKELYEFMLSNERTTPNKIAIDKPSIKLLSFMRKYYNLSDYIPQNNNYVVYRQFFSNAEDKKKPETSFINRSLEEPGLRKSALSHASARLEGKSLIINREIQDKTPERKIYVSVPPWAVSSGLGIGSTTNSLYGGHRK